ncbi:MAG: hypothetical protein N3B16_05395 [Candidatus Aminicenantes bacterium]|nr:hypothetical protein [Candidatus Aminicenantes bacterium]
MRKFCLILISLIFVLSCATFSRHYQLGAQAEMAKRWDEAVKYYERAALENPRESVYRIALLRAKIAASLYHLQEARRLVAEGKIEEAKKAYDQAIAYDPHNRALIFEAMSLTQEKSQLEKKPDQKKIEYPVKLKVSSEKVGLKFIEAPLKSIFQALGKFAGINILFDETFQDRPISIDLTNKTFEEALGNLCLISRNFYRVIDENSVIIVPDRPEKRLQYEVSAIRTFYLSNIPVEAVQSQLQLMLRTAYRAPLIMADKNMNCLTIRDSPANVELAEKLIKLWDKAKAEVIIDLEIMEVSRMKLRQLGLSFDQNIVGLKYSGTGVNNQGWFNLKDIDFTKMENYQLSVPAAFIQFLETDADTKIIAQPRLRGLADEEIRSLVGQRVPIPQTTFTPIAAGGVSQQPITSFVYQDVGLEIKIKPKIHFEREVTLDLEMKITSIAGTGIADIPIITTREVKNILRLKDGETNLLGGLLKDEERKSLKGIAGLKNLPIIGRLFSAEDTTVEQTDVVLTITPYIIRTLPLTEEDMKPIWVDVEGMVSPTQTTSAPITFIERLQAQEMEEIERAREEARRGNWIEISPLTVDVPKGREFRLAVNLRCQEEMANLSVNLRINPSVVKIKEILAGGIISQMGEKAPFLKNIESSGGSALIAFSSPQVGRGFKGEGNLAIIVCEAVNQGETEIAIASVTGNAPTGASLSFNSRGATIIVR